MSKNFNAKNILNIIREKKKFSLLEKDFSKGIQIQERSRSFNKIGKTLEEISNELSNQKSKANRFDMLESKIDYMHSDLKQEIGEVKDSVNTLLLFSFYKEDFFSHTQKQKMKNILKKKERRFWIYIIILIRMLIVILILTLILILTSTKISSV